VFLVDFDNAQRKPPGAWQRAGVERFNRSLRKVALETKAFTFECASCHKQTSVTAGTIMHGSKLSLTVWFWAAYLIASHANGISALQLQKQLGLGSYKSAWFLAAKLRLAMVAPGRSPLQGLVEADETTFPCRSKDDPVTGGGGRSAQGKRLIAGAVEVQDGRPGRIRLSEIKNFSAASLHGFLADNLARDAAAKTDGWAAYPGAKDIKYEPHVVGPMAAHIVLPWIHRVFANFKTWALGVYHGLRRKNSRPISTRSSSASIDAATAMPALPGSSPSASITNP
jgi:hypothetical protein